jgi:RNA polymerase sigma-70 factor (ECF subfamily)
MAPPHEVANRRPGAEPQPAHEEGLGAGMVAEFANLALPHLARLYAFAHRLTGDPSSAEDLVQEAYLKALQAFPTLRDPSRFRSWIYSILARLATDRHRLTEREVMVEDAADLERFSLYDRIADEDPLPYSDRLHEDFLEQFQDEDVRRALVALPEIYRVPLILAYVEDMSYRELSDVLKCPIGTVMSRLFRGRKALERALWDCARKRGLVRALKP